MGGRAQSSSITLSAMAMENEWDTEIEWGNLHVCNQSTNIEGLVVIPVCCSIVVVCFHVTMEIPRL